MHRVAPGALIRVCAPPPGTWQGARLVELGAGQVRFRRVVSPTRVDSLATEAIEGLDYEAPSERGDMTRGVIVGGAIGAAMGILLQGRGRNGDEFRGVGPVRFAVAGALAGMVVGAVITGRAESPGWIRAIGPSGADRVSCDREESRPADSGAEFRMSVPVIPKARTQPNNTLHPTGAPVGPVPSPAPTR